MSEVGALAVSVSGKATKRQVAQEALARRNEELALTSVAMTRMSLNDENMSSPPSPPCFTITHSAEKGREARALRTLPAGTLVIEEDAYCFCIRSSQGSKTCHFCCAPIANDVASPSTGCPTCALVHCCSTSCWSQLRVRHQVECAAWRLIAEWARRYDVDEDLCRILISAHSRLYREHHRSVPNKASKSDKSGVTRTTPGAGTKKKSRGGAKGGGATSSDFNLDDLAPPPTSTYSCDDSLTLAHLRDMSAHDALFPPPWHAAIRSVCEQILLVMPPVSDINVDVLHAVAVRVNTNAHAMLAPPPSNHAIGLGLFLRTSLLNHSCYPNCVYVSTQNGRMVVRTLREIGAGDELTVSYADMYMAREDRIAELRSARGFVCTCSRCTEPIRSSIDRLVGGIWCGCERASKRGGGGASVVPTLSDSATLVSQWLHEDSGRGLFVWSGRPHQPLDDSRTDYVCTRCGKRCSKNDRQARLAPLMKLYGSAQTAKQARQFASARSHLEDLLRLAPEFLPSLHELIPAVHVQLYNLCMHERAFDKAAEHARAVVERYQLVFPPNWSEIADFHFAQGDALAEHAKTLRADATEIVRSALYALQASVDMRRVACGEKHLRTIAAERALEDAARCC